MSRQEAIEKLAEVLAAHRPHKSYGCECMLRTAVSQINVDATPVLPVPWEVHIAEIAFEHAKGF
jgi:hypothetical protein